METPKLSLLKKSKHLSIGKHRLSESPKTSSRIVDLETILHTPPSSKSNSVQNDEYKCFTPLTKKKTFIAEESPSQDYEYPSPTTLPSQDGRSDFQDVGWEWGEKMSGSIQHNHKKKCVGENEEEKTKQKDLFPKTKWKSHEKRAALEQQSVQNENRGFYIFQKEIESIKNNNWNIDEDCELNSSLKENIKVMVCISSKNVESSGYSKTESSLKSKITDLSRAEASKCEEHEQRKQNSSVDLYLNDSGMDEMLFEATQTVEQNFSNKIEEKTMPKYEDLSKTDLAALTDETSFEGDAIDKLLLSIPDDELLKLSPSKEISGYSGMSQKGKTSFTRHNSMPNGPLENLVTYNSIKSLNRHNSMPPDAASRTTVNSNLGYKRLCTKEEMEQKRLDAKKRQLISQQKLKMLDQQNCAFNSKIKNSSSNCLSNWSSSLKSVKR